MALLLIMLITTLIVILLVLLFSPFHIGFFIEKKGLNTKANLYFSWFWKSFRLSFRPLKKEASIYLFGKKIKATDTSYGVKKKEKKSKKSRTPEPSVNMMVPFLKLLADILNAFSLEKIYLELRIGTGSPAGTGMISGYFYALNGLISTLPFDKKIASITFHPYFNEERYDIKGEFKIKSRLKNYIAPVLRFVLSEPFKTIAKNKIFR